jgi:DNA-binding transcriptional regulator YiaG
MGTRAQQRGFKPMDGRELLQIRKRLGLSRAEMARQLDYDPSSLFKWERSAEPIVPVVVAKFLRREYLTERKAARA